MASRLLIVTHLFPRWDGDLYAKYLQFLCRRLPEHGVEPIVLAPHDAGAALAETIDGIPVHRVRYADRDEDEDLAYRGTMHRRILRIRGALRFKRLLDAMTAKALELVESEKIDVVAGHWIVPSALILRRVAARRPVPMIVTSHGTDVDLVTRRARWLYAYLRGFCRSLARWTTVSSFLRRSLLELDPELESRVDVLPLPHDKTAFFPDPAIERERDRIVSVTRYTPQKRVDQLLTAFDRVVKQRPATVLEIFGQEEPPPAIRNQAEELGISDRITFHVMATQEEIRVACNRATVVALNSVGEGFGLALSEAMLCGAAVVGTDSGGIPDIVDPERTGLLVPPDDPPALSDALLRILEDDGLRELLAEAGHREAWERYDPSTLAGRYAEIVTQAVQGRPS